VDKELEKRGSEVTRVGLKGQECTFRRLNSVNGKIHETTIDHVLVRGNGIYGSKVSDSGMDANDHAMILGWVEVENKGKNIREVKAMRTPTIRPTDKGATKKLEKIFKRTTDKELGEMNMAKIIKETMKKVKIIYDNRNNRTNRDGWSPVTRIIAMRISVHGTALKIRGRPDYARVMKGRVEEMRRREKQMVLSEEEVGWMRDQGIRVEAVDWDEWDNMYRDEVANFEQMNRLKRLNSGRRRKELRLICNSRMYRIQSDADAGKIGGAIRLIMNRKKGYKMECLVDGDECIREPNEVDKRAFEHFKDWFHRTEEEKRDGHIIDVMIREKDFGGFQKKTEELGIGADATEKLWKAMGKKYLDDEGKKEGAALSDYVPTYE
jgi:hypothetical protein